MGLLQGSSMDRRFFHSLGASRLDRTICSMAGTVGMRMTVGANIGADGEGIPESDLVLLWGTNTLTSNPHLWPFVLRGARARRAHHRASTRSARAPPSSATSGSPSARAPTPRSRSAMMHVLFARGLEDRDYLERYTLGARRSCASAPRE